MNTWRRFAVGGAAAAASLAAYAVYRRLTFRVPPPDVSPPSYPDPTDLTPLDLRIAELARQYTPDAVQLLAELVRIPLTCDDPLCGTSNHEGPRLTLLADRLSSIGAVLDPSDVRMDTFGNLIWSVADPDDPMPPNERKVVFFSGHSDTVDPLRSQWHARLGSGIDPFLGLTDPSSVSEERLRDELRSIPPQDEWDDLLFGRGTCDQLQGVVSQVYATKILLETAPLGSLRGVIVVSVVTVCEEVNEGGGPRSIMNSGHLERRDVPDCVILTEPTGDLERGPCGIGVGQRGRCQVLVDVRGPAGGVNPLEHGALIIADAAATSGFRADPVLGVGSRVATVASVEAASDCAVPTRMQICFDRRLVGGEDPVREIEALSSVRRARAAGCNVAIGIPAFTDPTWAGEAVNNIQEYLPWVTPPGHAAIRCAVAAYARTVPPGDGLRSRPWVAPLPYSTDGVGYVLRKGEFAFSIEGKNWIDAGESVHPPMFVIGAGFYQHAHTIGEYVHKAHLRCPIAVLARFPSLFADES